MPPRNDDNNSEREDNPRRILDIDGDFTLLDSDIPFTGTFKLPGFQPLVTDEDGNKVPLTAGVYNPRPIPSPALVQRA